MPDNFLGNSHYIVSKWRCYQKKKNQIYDSFSKKFWYMPAFYLEISTSILVFVMNLLMPDTFTSFNARYFHSCLEMMLNFFVFYSDHYDMFLFLANVSWVEVTLLNVKKKNKSVSIYERGSAMSWLRIQILEHVWVQRSLLPLMNWIFGQVVQSHRKLEK